jgi:hypothetical protein
MSEIEKVLCEATNIARNVKTKESTQRYLKRLLNALEKKFDDKKRGQAADDDWETIGATKGAQEWFNDAIKADKAGKPLPTFDGEEADEAPAEKKAATNSKAAPAAKSAKAPKEAPDKKSSSPGKAGARAVIIQLTIKKPGISVDDMMTELNKKGLKPTKSAVSSLRSFTRATIKCLQGLGYVKEIEL